MVAQQHFFGLRGALGHNFQITVAGGHKSGMRGAQALCQLFARHSVIHDAVVLHIAVQSLVVGQHGIQSLIHVPHPLGQLLFHIHRKKPLGGRKAARRGCACAAHNRPGRQPPVFQVAAHIIQQGVGQAVPAAGQTRGGGIVESHHSVGLRLFLGRGRRQGHGSDGGRVPCSGSGGRPGSLRRRGGRRALSGAFHGLVFVAGAAGRQNQGQPEAAEQKKRFFHGGKRGRFPQTNLVRQREGSRSRKRRVRLWPGSSH